MQNNQQNKVFSILNTNIDEFLNYTNNLKQNSNTLNDLTKLDKSYTDNELIFDEAKEGLWYNWANSVGQDHIAISYSAGLTQLIQPFSSFQNPILKIFKKSSLPENELLYEKTFDYLEGIRSLLVVDPPCSNSFLLIGSFSYENPNNLNEQVKSYIYKLDLVTYELSLLYVFDNDNSIRTMKIYKDHIFIATQNDFNSESISTLYHILIKDIGKPLKSTQFYDQTQLLKGSIWSFSIHHNVLYLSIPKKSVDPFKLSNFNIRGRLFYVKLQNVLCKSKCSVYSMIGNDHYLDGLGENALSTFQIIFRPNDPYGYIYSLSDFVYQSLSLSNNIVQNNLDLSSLNVNQSFLNVLFELRELVSNLDITGSKIFKFDTRDLFCSHKIPTLTTLVGYPSYHTINESSTSNGYQNFLNVYLWCATSDKDDIYFGSLDIRSLLYSFFVRIMVILYGNLINNIEQILLELPEFLIIYITEIVFNKYLSFPIDLENKQLYFDIIKLNERQEFSKITSSGFSNTSYFNPYADDGCRNLNIIKNNDQKYLLIGSTCYQKTNFAKNYLLDLNL